MDAVIVGVHHYAGHTEYGVRYWCDGECRTQDCLPSELALVNGRT